MTSGQLDLVDRYSGSLRLHLRAASEETLSSGYELGRIALGSGAGLFVISRAHHETLRALLSEGLLTHERLVLAEQFLAEAMSPFEMTLGGYREANDQLRRQSETLRCQRDELENLNRELESFSYSVSHDLRAPLRSIDGFSQALLEDFGDALNDEGRKHLRYVRESAQEMAKLIDDLLGLARVTRSPLNLTRVDLTALTRTVADRLRAADPTRRANVGIEEGLFVDGDARLLAVLLENLLSNAWKFTSKRPHADISVGMINQEGRPVYFVRDNGAGFDMKFAGQLFGAFQRLHPVTEFEGTGIGLATVQRIVHRHGGRIWAEGEVDRGATFYFALGAGTS